jgi:hypothetical protein
MRPKAFLVAAVLTVAYMSTGCATFSGSINQRERGAQQSTVDSIVCRGDDPSGYFVASKTPDAQRFEMLEAARRHVAEGKCSGGAK